MAIQLAMFDGCLIEPEMIEDSELKQKEQELTAAKVVITALLRQHGSLSLSHQSAAYVKKPEYMREFARAMVLNEKTIKLAIDAMLSERKIKKVRRCYGDANAKRERIELANSASADAKVSTTLDSLRAAR